MFLLSFHNTQSFEINFTHIPYIFFSQYFRWSNLNSMLGILLHIVNNSEHFAAIQVGQILFRFFIFQEVYPVGKFAKNFNLLDREDRFFFLNLFRNLLLDGSANRLWLKYSLTKCWKKNERTYSFNAWSFVSRKAQLDSLITKIEMKLWKLSIYLMARRLLIVENLIVKNVMTHLPYLMRYMHPLASSVHDQILFHFSI